MTTDYQAMLEVAIAEAQRGLDEGGIPIGAALFHADGKLLGCGHNRRVQEGDPSVHGETDAFRKAGRQRNYRDTYRLYISSRAGYWRALAKYQSAIGQQVTHHDDDRAPANPGPPR